MFYHTCIWVWARPHGHILSSIALCASAMRKFGFCPASGVFKARIWTGHWPSCGSGDVRGVALALRVCENVSVLFGLPPETCEPHEVLRFRAWWRCRTNNGPPCRRPSVSCALRGTLGRQYVALWPKHLYPQLRGSALVAFNTLQVRRKADSRTRCVALLSRCYRLARGSGALWGIFRWPLMFVQILSLGLSRKALPSSATGHSGHSHATRRTPLSMRDGVWVASLKCLVDLLADMSRSSAFLQRALQTCGNDGQGHRDDDFSIGRALWLDIC